MTTNVLELFENNQICFFVKSSNVLKSDLRLDPTHFVDDFSITLNDKIRFKKLKDFVFSINEPNLFTRYYCKRDYGLPYISSSEMSEIEPPVNSRYISKVLTNNIAQYVIKRGQILVSAAGTVGSIVIATKELDGVAGTSDILRIDVDMQTNLGFIYTYLTSSYGANELSNLAYGAVIKRVRGAQLEELKTPKIDEDSILRMNELILSSLNKRDIANELIKKARSLVLQYNNLPPLSETKVNTNDPKNVVQILQTNLNEFTSDYRLDAHFYNPIARAAISNIQQNALHHQPLKELTKDIIIGKRFKRNYVESDHGTPFIGSKNILQIRPTELKYLSNSEIGFMDDLMLQKGMILIACSGSLGGTFGKASLVQNNFERHAASQHILRIVANEELIDSGYLYAFLSSEYGYECITRYRWGALIDEIDDDDMGKIDIPFPSEKQQKQIGDLVRQAYDLRAEAIKLEDEAQEILTKALTGK
jgi:type I restriction enzyme S subunit